ncbi:MAG: WD40 repeat domain-containing protein [Pirellulaceae bacterium]
MSGPLLRSRLLVACLLLQVMGQVTISTAQQLPVGVVGAKTDLYGDPLPNGAVARLGTTRFRHAGYFRGVAFLPDNVTFVTYGEQKTISFWEAETGQRLREIRTDPMTIQGFALSRDGKQIAVGGYWSPEDRTKPTQGELRVLNTATGATIKTFPRESRDANNLGLTFSKDGRLLFSLGYQGILRVEEIASGAEILQNKFPADNGPALALSPDGKTLGIVCGPNARKFFLWDWQTGAEPREIKLVAAEGGDGQMVFSPSGRHVVFCGSRNEPMHVWEVESGKLVARLAPPDPDSHTARLSVFSPDGKQLIAPAGSNQNWRLHVWNTDTWKYDRQLDIKSLGVAISADSRLLTTGRRVFSFETGQEIGGIEAAHNSEISRILTTPSGRAITGSFDNSVRIWALATSRQEQKLVHGSFIQDLALSTSGELLASASLDDTIRLWNVASGKEIYRLPGHGTQGTTQAVAFVGDGKSFASFGPDFYMRIWDVRTGKALAESRIQPTGVKIPGENDERDLLDRLSIDGVRISPGGKYLVLCIQAKIHVFDVATGKELRLLEREGSSLAVLDISPDQRQLLACSRGNQIQTKLPDGRIRYSSEKETIVSLWDLETGNRLQTFKAPDEARAAAFAPDGQRFAIATHQPKVQVAIYDLQGVRQQVVEDVPSRVHALAFSADGKLIAGLDDTSALVYDLKAPMKK